MPNHRNKMQHMQAKVVVMADAMRNKEQHEGKGMGMGIKQLCVVEFGRE